MLHIGPLRQNNYRKKLFGGYYEQLVYAAHDTGMSIRTELFVCTQCSLRAQRKLEMNASWMAEQGKWRPLCDRFIPADTLLSGNPNVKDIKEHVVLTVITFQKGHLFPHV